MGQAGSERKYDMEEKKVKRFEYKPPRKIKPLDPNKQLAPYTPPRLKAFDRHLPGQGMMDFSGDGEISIVYPEDDGQDDEPKTPSYPASLKKAIAETRRQLFA